MVDVRFELTTNDPWSVDDAICDGISPLGYWQEVNCQSGDPEHGPVVPRDLPQNCVRHCGDLALSARGVSSHRRH